MKQIRFSLAFAFLLGAAFALVSCSSPLEPPSPEGNYWAFDGRTNSYYRCSASFLAAGEHCLVYGENGLNISVSFAGAVAAEFDNSIYPVITGAFGYPVDVDNNGKIIILLLDIKEPDYGDTSYTAGYFNPTDLFDIDYSNRGEMLYINYKYPGSVIFYSTMAHEFQHLINRSLHLESAPMDLWIDEGLASAAEYLYKKNYLADGHQHDRISYFNDDEYKTIRKGNNFFIWYGYWEGSLNVKPSQVDVLANYATAYLFFQWLRIHADNDSVYGDIINSNFTDYRAVTAAARQRILPYFSGISDDEAGWAELLGAWYAANRLRATSGIYGYKNEITLNFTWRYPGSSHSAPLYPGEGVYSGNGTFTTFTPAQEGGGNIRYLGLGGGDVDSSPSYEGTYLLTYNGAVTGASSETGYVADTVPVMSLFGAMAAESGGTAETPEAILRRWDGGRVFLEKMQGAGALPPVE